MSHFVALRPHQWTKNLIVFAAPLFGFSLSLQTLLGSLLAFGLFCGLSSSFYLINDVVDVESDRRHPIKCKRPIANGLVSIPVALAMAFGLMGGALVLGWLQTALLGTTLLCYAALQSAYNLKLKHLPLLDIIAIATGFILRAIAGGAVNSIELSPWFLLCTAMLALFLGIEKRKAELRLAQLGAGKTRRVLQYYSSSILTRMESTVTTGAIMSYALWSAGPIVNGASTAWMLLTLPFVMYGIFRYQLISEPTYYENLGRSNKPSSLQQTERPEDVLFQDKPILLTVVSWIGVAFMILWLKSHGIIE
ncbi:MAG: decaprenyl-phosphate phosphoribosyltransferase [Cyanobacteria bacterium P01_D01_bin.44]